jgi:diaminohydroxyphosphoribosylaminopyrimidine deaminase / 5-amino-6-(5-phosphoribosylamino)uracil reductase
MPEQDSRFLAAAIRLGAGGLGSTWPNPAVGAIVEKNGVVVGHGRTGRGGRPHGEALALAMAGGLAHGATLYVSLEPCAHQGKTPPCTDAIIAARVARTVVTRLDPDPRVAGKGLQRLRDAGIEVSSGLLEDRATAVQAGHISRIGRGRPHVLLKLAVSADGAIGRRDERQVTVTGERARRHAQALRSGFDAILVGRGTIEADDPQLTCRLPGLENRSPIRVVLDSGRRVRSDAKVFEGVVPTWVFTAVDDHQGDETPMFRIPRTGDGLDLNACLNRLAAEGITRLLVEGGALIARSFLEADLVDEVMLFRSSQPLGGDLVPALAGLPLSYIECSDRFRARERRAFGDDRMSRYERVR